MLAEEGGEDRVLSVSGILAKSVEKGVLHLGDRVESALIPRTIRLSTRRYSGKLQLRLGEGLHRRLAMEAAEERLA